MRHSCSDFRQGAPPSRRSHEVSMTPSQVAARKERPSLDPSTAQRLANLLKYPFKLGTSGQSYTRRSMSVDVDHRAQERWASPRHSRSFHLDSLVDSVCIDEGAEEIDFLNGTTVALRDGSHIIVPPSHVPSSVPSIHSMHKHPTNVCILTVQWQSGALGLMLQNIENRPVVKAFTDEVDWHTNPQLTQLLPRDELVAINETSVILLGFDAAIDRLRHVEKPATLQFRRVLVHDSTSQGVVPHASPSDESFLLSSPIWGYGNTSSSRTSLYTPPTSMVPILQQHSMPASDVDIDDARESLGKTELFPLSTTHNVFTMLRWSGEPLGIALQKHPTSGHLEIKLCTGGGLSASHGCLAVGDVLVSVAGVPMQTFGLSTCLDFLNATQKPVSMVFRRHGYDPTDVIRLRLILSLDRANPPPPRTEPPNSANNTLLTDDDDQAPQEYTVEWDVNMPTRLTLQPMFCKHNLVLIVLSVHASSMAQERVQVGDRLMAINGLVVNELPLDTVKAMLAVTAQLTFHHHISTWTV